MNKQTVIDYFGGITKAASTLGIAHTSIIGWQEIIPEGMAARLDRITNGELKYDHEFYMAYKKNKKAAA
jgi:transcriptional repressor of cell division inhibition gene dicB